MNQILITKKLYVTPELKKKKKFYKVHFILSIILIAILSGSYLYAAYDRDRSEAVSQEVLSGINDNTTVNDGILVAYLDSKPEEDQGQGQAQTQNQQRNKQTQNQVITASDGNSYSTVATVSIPSLNLTYPVLSETSDELLKISPCKFWGPNPNEVGNFCIVGHNYRNKKFFSKVPNLEMGETVNLTDMAGKTLTYKIYDKYTVEPTDVRCTSQLTNGKKEVTLITCTDDSQQRVVVKATQV
ncbi:MAG: sortase [Clostridia bacterium]|nr:sortase [Clostridia bacterium]